MNPSKNRVKGQFTIAPDLIKQLNEESQGYLYLNRPL